MARASVSEAGAARVTQLQRRTRRPVLAPSLSSPSDAFAHPTALSTRAKRTHEKRAIGRRSDVPVGRTPDEAFSLDATGLFHWCRQRAFHEALLVRCSLLSRCVLYCTLTSVEVEEQ